jgi:hypothetical protein
MFQLSRGFWKKMLIVLSGNVLNFFSETDFKSPYYSLNVYNVAMFTHNSVLAN